MLLLVLFATAKMVLVGGGGTFSVVLLESGNGLAQLRLAGARKGIHLFAPLNEDKSRHGTDSVLGGEFLILVDVHLENDHILVLLRDFLQHGRNQAAWSAPGGEKVDNHQLIAGVAHLLLEVFGVLNLVDHFDSGVGVVGLLSS